MCRCIDKIYQHLQKTVFSLYLLHILVNIEENVMETRNPTTVSLSVIIFTIVILNHS